jgi:ABC-2 type transport system ATP-binding protein
MLKVHQLTQRYGSKVALKALSFTLQPGGFNALLGPNGAGKSTLFQVLTGLWCSNSSRLTWT